MNQPNYDYDEEYLGDLFDEALEIIMDWKRTTDDSIILDGTYNKSIVRYIVESVNISGLEGQSYSSANGSAKTFIATPEANLKSSIPQVI